LDVVSNPSGINMTAMNIVGSPNMDMGVRIAHLSASGETILGQEYHTIPDGKGANQAVAAARLGAVVHMFDRVAQDPYG
jgi:ribokinase